MLLVAIILMAILLMAIGDYYVVNHWWLFIGGY
jgi:hypothetical protein